MTPIPLDAPLDGLNWLIDPTESNDLLDCIQQLATLSRWSRFNLRALMIDAIQEGYTYQDVADAIGVSRQSAWEAVNPRGGLPLSVNLDQLKLF